MLEQRVAQRGIAPQKNLRQLGEAQAPALFRVRRLAAQLVSRLKMVCAIFTVCPGDVARSRDRQVR